MHLSNNSKIILTANTFAGHRPLRASKNRNHNDWLESTSRSCHFITHVVREVCKSPQMICLCYDQPGNQLIYKSKASSPKKSPLLSLWVTWSRPGLLSCRAKHPPVYMYTNIPHKNTVNSLSWWGETLLITEMSTCEWRDSVSWLRTPVQVWDAPLFKWDTWDRLTTSTKLRTCFTTADRYYTGIWNIEILCLSKMTNIW